MQREKGFFNVEERDNDHNIWNGFPKKMGGNKYKIKEDV